MLGEVREGIASGRAENLKRAAHSFKGSVGNLTDGGVFEAARALETLGREGMMADAPAAFERLEREVEQLLRVMRGFA